MFYLNPTGGKVVRFWVGDEVVEENIKNQMTDIATMPFIYRNGISCMPDVHFGKGGAAVGAVIPTINAVIPSTVGVDLSCGMAAVKTSLNASDLPDSLADIRSRIESLVPVGHNVVSNQDILKTNLSGRSVFLEQLKEFAKSYPKMFSRMDRINASLGTLGGGNHFIEICLDENDQVWVMLHSGSRGFGAVVGNHFIEKAREEMERYYINLPNKDLSYLVRGTEVFDSYVRGVELAGRFAATNRELMMLHTLNAMKSVLGVFDSDLMVVDCHHNYLSLENHFGENIYITRKGAISAREGQMGIIPGSMGTKSYIVRGKGENSSYQSASHGAGRVLSRNEARKQFSLEDFKHQTCGVECRKDEALIDEIPGAYKDIDTVMENQKDLVEIVHTLKAVLCVKG